MRSKSPLNRALEDMLLSTHADLQEIMLKCLFGSDESKAQAKEKLNESVAKFLIPLEKFLPATGFMCERETPGFADFII